MASNLSTLNLYSFLSGKVPISSLVSTRIYPLKLPEKPTLPAITFHCYSVESEYNLTGNAGFASSKWQIDIWSTTEANALAIGEAVRATLQAYSGPIGTCTCHVAILDNQQMLYEASQSSDDAPIYHIAQQYRILYPEDELVSFNGQVVSPEEIILPVVLAGSGINVTSGVDGQGATTYTVVSTCPEPLLTVCKQTASATNNSSTVPTSIPGLSFTLVSGRYYMFKFYVTFQTVATTTGVGFVFTSPTTSYANWKVAIRQAAAGTDQSYENSSLSLTTVLVNTAVVAANTDYIATIEGYCTPSQNGTLQLQTRSEINLSQVTIQQGGLGYLIVAP